MRRFREILPATLALCLLWSAAVSAAELPLDYPLSAAFEDAVAPGDLKAFSGDLGWGQLHGKDLKDYDLTMVNIRRPGVHLAWRRCRTFQRFRSVFLAASGDPASTGMRQPSGRFWRSPATQGITLRSVDGDFRKNQIPDHVHPDHTLFFDREGRGVGAASSAGRRTCCHIHGCHKQPAQMPMGKPEMDLRAEDETETETEPGPEIEKETETED